MMEDTSKTQKGLPGKYLRKIKKMKVGFATKQCSVCVSNFVNGIHSKNLKNPIYSYKNYNKTLKRRHYSKITMWTYLSWGLPEALASQTHQLPFVQNGFT